MSTVSSGVNPTPATSIMSAHSGGFTVIAGRSQSPSHLLWPFSITSNIPASPSFQPRPISPVRSSSAVTTPSGGLLSAAPCPASSAISSEKVWTKSSKGALKGQVVEVPITATIRGSAPKFVDEAAAEAAVHDDGPLDPRGKPPSRVASSAALMFTPGLSLKVSTLPRPLR